MGNKKNNNKNQGENINYEKKIYKSNNAKKKEVQIIILWSYAYNLRK